MNNLSDFFKSKQELIQEASLAKIATNLSSKDFKSAGLPDNGLYFIFDTETTGLSLKGDDLITEMAIICYDSNLNEIENKLYHGAIKKYENLPDDKNPYKIIEQVKQELRGLIKGEDKINRLVIGVFSDLKKAESFTAQDKFKEVFKKRMSIFLQKNHPEKQDQLAASPRIRDLFFTLRKLVKASELKNIFKMTSFGKLKDPEEVKDEGELAQKSVEFVNSVMKENADKIAIVVAHNYPFDAKMLRQAVSRKQAQLANMNAKAEDMGIKYPFEKFIDTAHFTRKIINKLLLGIFIYYSRLYVMTKDERYKKIALKIKPNLNNIMGTLAEYFKVPNLSWHTAANDVRATAQILKYLIAMNSRVSMYFKDKHKDIIEKIQTELEMLGNDEASGGKAPDFFDAMRGDLYRKTHEKLYAEFTGTTVEKKASNKETKDEKIEYLKMLSQEFPGLGNMHSFLEKPKSSGSRPSTGTTSTTTRSNFTSGSAPASKPKDLPYDPNNSMV